ncbi:MAG: sulfite exporter TauE/SafE family protein [Gammaproteobacteria bacterium]|nr:sulfite exporter TauE/SafE family protein [Gammaproteobacteria bacterium]
MCGGIAGALSMRAGSRPGASAASAGLAVPLYSVGRIGSYALLGTLAGALGAVATELIPAALATLRILAGVLLVAMGLYLAGSRNGLMALDVRGGLFGHLQPLAARTRGPLEPLALGMVLGLLPCGLVVRHPRLDPDPRGSAPGCGADGRLRSRHPARRGARGFAGMPPGRALRHSLVRRGAGARRRPSDSGPW